MIMKNIMRTSITLPKSLFEALDSMLSEMGYPNRSKAIQDAITDLLAEHKWLKEERGERTGVLVVIYDHDKPGVNKKLIDVQHSYRDEIISSTHIHLDEHNCLETVTVKGEAHRLRKLIEEFKTRKGVKEARFIVMLPK
ncbi:nickel-responsive transcriptional regulator NikR [[Eubacterium] cellulosolvens]